MDTLKVVVLVVFTPCEGIVTKSVKMSGLTHRQKGESNRMLQLLVAMWASYHQRILANIKHELIKYIVEFDFKEYNDFASLE